MERRELFSSLVSPFKNKGEQETKEIIVRPPYFSDQSEFLKECIDCDGKCATFCEEQIIIIQEDKTPKLDLSIGGCTFCDKCAEVCVAGVLKLEYRQNINATIQIDMLTCLSWNNTMCFSCKDPCLDDAIDFLAMFKPSINDKCTSCGFCIKSCPVGAITIG